MNILFAIIKPKILWLVSKPFHEISSDIRLKFYTILQHSMVSDLVNNELLPLMDFLCLYEEDHSRVKKRLFWFFFYTVFVNWDLFFSLTSNEDKNVTWMNWRWLALPQVSSCTIQCWSQSCIPPHTHTHTQKKRLHGLNYFCLIIISLHTRILKPYDYVLLICSLMFSSIPSNYDL